MFYNVLKMPDLCCLKNVRFKTCVKEHLRSDVYTTSKEIIFSYLALSEIFRKFLVFVFRLVFRYEILYITKTF